MKIHNSNSLKSFLNEIEPFDPILIESVRNAYYIIYENISDYIHPVIDVCEEISNNAEHFVYENGEYVYSTSILGIPFKFIIKNTGREQYMTSIDYNIYFFSPFIFNDFETRNYDKIKTFFSSPQNITALGHEISHIIEFSKIETKNGLGKHENIVHNAIDRHKSNEGKIRVKQDISYHSDKTERFPNRIGSMIAVIKYSKDNNIADPDKLYKLITSAYDKVTGNSVKNTTETQRKKIYQKTANVIHNVTKDK